MDDLPEMLKGNLFAYGDFTGRRLMPILHAALRLPEDAAMTPVPTVHSGHSGERPGP